MDPMHADQQPYRELYRQILDYGGDALFDDVLHPWLRGVDAERRWLDELRARRGDPIPRVAVEERWRLYALSRIIDLLQLSFAPRAGDAEWNVAAITRAQHTRFMDALGLEPVERADFHPFFHEVVTVDELPDENAPPGLVGLYWPGCTLGPLLIGRAGCRVEAGRRHLRKEIAERSTLYWAYARNNRPSADASHGWGGNSQWRTDFRRDYALGSTLHYNVDARPPPFRMDEDLSAAERLELLRHRCFVTTPKRDDDRWPYGETWVEDAPS
jgi:hypothetical protein